MRFLANMGISPATVSFLCQAGHDAQHLHEQSLDGMDDTSILEKARQENRIVLTSDLDFGDLLAASGDDLPSVVIFRLHDMRPENVNHHLSQLLIRHAAELERGAVVSVTEHRFRIRRLPIAGSFDL